MHGFGFFFILVNYLYSSPSSVYCCYHFGFLPDDIRYVYYYMAIISCVFHKFHVSLCIGSSLSWPEDCGEWVWASFSVPPCDQSWGRGVYSGLTQVPCQPLLWDVWSWGTHGFNKNVAFGKRRLHGLVCLRCMCVRITCTCTGSPPFLSSQRGSGWMIKVKLK